MGFDSVVGRQKRPYPAAESYFFALARDYERWGLAPEAEVARYRGRQATINRLLIDAKALQYEQGSARPLP